MTVTKTLSVQVCRGPSCCLMGSRSLVEWCQDLIDAGIELDYQITSCTGHCQEAPVVQWNGRFLTQMSPAGMTRQLIGEAES